MAATAFSVRVRQRLPDAAGIISTDTSEDRSHVDPGTSRESTN